MYRTPVRLAAAALALLVIAGCKSAPSGRPMKMGDVASGPTTVEAVRAQLKGDWELMTLDIFNTSGEKHAVQASGRLQFDDHGNLSMKGTVAGTEQIDPSVLNLSGQVAINPTDRTFRFVGIEAGSADDRRVDPKLDAAHLRYYEFIGDELKTTVKAADGTTTATATWKRMG